MWGEAASETPWKNRGTRRFKSVLTWIATVGHRRVSVIDGENLGPFG